MDLLLWIALAVFSFALIGLAVWLKKDSGFFWLPVLVIGGLAAISTGLFTLSDGIEVQNGSIISENWTYAQRACNYTWSNGTTNFTDIGTCWFANASVMQETVTREPLEQAYTEGFAILLFFAGLAAVFFAILAGLHKRWW